LRTATREKVRNECAPYILLVRRWESMAHWKAVPKGALDAADAAFRAAMGAVYPVLGCVAYEVL
jgi:hypothetical protein